MVRDDQAGRDMRFVASWHVGGVGSVAGSRQDLEANATVIVVAVQMRFTTTFGDGRQPSGNRRRGERCADRQQSFTAGFQMTMAVLMEVNETLAIVLAFTEQEAKAGHCFDSLCGGEVGQHKRLAHVLDYENSRKQLRFRKTRRSVEPWKPSDLCAQG